MADDKSDSSYYRRPGIVPLILVPAGMVLVTVAAFMPDAVPYAYLGTVGYLTKLLVTHVPWVLCVISVTAWIIHAGDTVYAVRICRDMNINNEATWKWAIQTFIYGWFSLRFLLNYKGKRKSSE